MMQLNNFYQRDDFIKFLEEDFLTDFKKDIRPVKTNSLTSIKKAQYLGESKNLYLQVFEFIFEGSANKRVALTKDAFSVMKSSKIYNALAVFHTEDSEDWRFSLLTTTPEPTTKGKVSLTYSNPKRLSFFLGPNAKINTPTKFLISKGKIVDFDDLKSRFSIEVVNKEFYKEISQAFTKLVSGLLKLPSMQDKSQTNLEFAVRLIGRIIFCWFLREKKSDAGLSLMPKELLSIEAVKKNKDYYHTILEPIFFEVLNKPVKSRRDEFAKVPFLSIPYLNGGLFSPQEDDFYKRMNGDFQSQFHNTLVIPDTWLSDLFEILETYNFTIDENTSYDEELSIDPEMLGRIFENLLAEINPETGESARKSTGSYYTPRTIVNYMVDESLLLYLKEQTGIKEEKLGAIISYDLNDDLENPVSTEEKEKIIEALEKVKILDPACGSGAFPIGALQKIVFILQQTDPDGQLWFKKQIKNTSPEVKRVIEREFEHKNFDYIRKLGIIRENIYGVDIQAIATEISRLRCFLTLIVDERIQDDAENRGIEPLPNLDFKFVTANSLIGLPKIDLSQQSMFDDYQKIDYLKNIRDQYFNASGIEREQLKTEFVTQQKRLVDQLIKEHGFMGVAKAELTQKLTDWEPFTHKSTSWFDPEWMFGIKDGFDIVIANPPYVDSEQMVKSEPEIRKLYAKLYTTAKGNWDLFVIFVEKGINLVRENGVLTFIIPNKVLSTNYTKDIRKFLLTKSIQEIRDYSRVKVFIDQDIYPVTLVLKNITSSNSEVCRMTTMKNLEEILQTNAINADYFYQDIYWDRYFFDKKTLRLLLKINLQQKLSQIIKEIFSSATVSEAYEIKKFLFDDNNRDGYKLINTGTIDRYISLWGQKKTQYIKDCYTFPRISSNDLKNVNANREFQAKSPKIIIAGMSKNIEAFFDQKGEYLAGKSTSIILGNPKILIILVGLLNSKLITFFVNHFYHSLKMAGGYLNIEPEIIGNLPISSEMLDTQIGKYVIKLIDSRNEKDKIDILDKIDKKVYELYRLSPEEIAIVEGRQNEIH